MLLHHPDFPLKNVPATNAPTSAAANRAAVAGPLWLNSGRRDATTATNTPIAMTYPYSLNQSGVVSARVNLRYRGVWFIAASGQMLRQTPGATKNSRGSV